MASDYENVHAEYRKLAKAAAGGDTEALKQKAGVMQHIRQIERESARAGTVLNAVYEKDRIKVDKTQVRSKRSMQEEYIGKFDGEKQVVVDDNTGPETLQNFHRRRLIA